MSACFLFNDYLIGFTEHRIELDGLKNGCSLVCFISTSVDIGLFDHFHFDPSFAAIKKKH